MIYTIFKKVRDEPETLYGYVESKENLKAILSKVCGEEMEKLKDASNKYRLTYEKVEFEKVCIYSQELGKWYDGTITLEVSFRIEKAEKLL